MQKPIDKGTELWMMFGEFFKLYSKYGNPENTDEYWKALINDTIKFGEDFEKVFRRTFNKAIICNFRAFI